jgi:hypothetical protein
MNEMNKFILIAVGLALLITVLAVVIMMAIMNYITKKNKKTDGI